MRFKMPKNCLHFKLRLLLSIISRYIRYLLDLTDDITEPRDWRTVDCVQAYYAVRCFYIVILHHFTFYMHLAYLAYYVLYAP